MFIIFIFVLSSKSKSKKQQKFIPKTHTDKKSHVSQLKEKLHGLRNENIELKRQNKNIRIKNKRLREEKKEFQKKPDIKGGKGESLFMQWLKDKNIAFIYLEQSPKTYNYDYIDMDAINEEGYYEGDVGFKRADFIIKFESRLIAIDVKNLELQKSEKSGKYPEYLYYPITKEEDLERLRVFEGIFKIPVFYVFVSKRNDGWEWASLDTVEKCYLNKYHHYQVSFNKTRYISGSEDLSSFLKDD